MIIISDSVLVESKSDRDNQLERVSPERATEVLAQVKPFNQGNHIFLPHSSLKRWGK